MTHKIALGLSEQIAAADPSKPGRRYHVYVAFTGDVETLRARGFELHAPLAGSARAMLTAEQIKALAELDEVISVQPPAQAFPTLDESLEAIKVDLDVGGAWNIAPLDPVNYSAKGRGVIIGVIDAGVDVFHGGFRKDDGSSRVLHLWDQTFTYDTLSGQPRDRNSEIILPLTDYPRTETGDVVNASMGRMPLDLGLNWGMEFDQEQINAAFAQFPNGSDLPISLRDSSPVGHGTHCAGIAAGDGSQADRCDEPDTYVGVAPEADLVVVKVGSSDKYVVDITAAVEYIFARARAVDNNVGKPCVISISLATHLGPRSGHGVEENRVAGLIGATGEAVVIAAGNDRHYHLHAALSVPTDETRSVKFLVMHSVRKARFWISSDPASFFRLQLLIPGGPETTPILGWGGRRELNEHGYQFILDLATSQLGDPDRHHHLTIAKQDEKKNVDPGTWGLKVLNTDMVMTVDANLHFWAWPELREFDNQVHSFMAFLPDGTNPSPQDANLPLGRPEDWIKATITAIASGREVITVGSYKLDTEYVSSFSSQGPAPVGLANGLYPASSRRKPDLLAPGEEIHAPMAEARRCWAQCWCCIESYHDMNGTSMATPHVAGVVALMLAQNKNLSASDIRGILDDTARTPEDPPADHELNVYEELYGAGLVNAEEAVQDAHNRAQGGGGTPTPFQRVVHPPPGPAGPRRRGPAIDLPGLISDWEKLFGRRPAWQLFAALISKHFDEVKRLIDHNRRVGAVWKRHGGPEVVRSAVFGQRPIDPPVPERIGDRPAGELVTRLLKLLDRFGGSELRADIAKYGAFVRALPGRRVEEIDEMLADRFT